MLKFERSHSIQAKGILLYSSCIKFFFVVTISIGVLGCSGINKSPVSEDQITEKKVEQYCDSIKYGLISARKDVSRVWRIKYLEYISECAADSTQVIELAKTDANNNRYNFFIYGLLGEKSAKVIEAMYITYNIVVYSPGCIGSMMGNIYNQEQKKNLRNKKGIDFDSLYHQQSKLVGVSNQ